MKSTNLKTLLCLLSIVVFAALFSSCKKKESANNTDYFVKANVNGAVISYTGFTSAMFLTMPSGGATPYNVLNIEGKNNPSSATDILAVVITDYDKITTKTYTDAVVGYTIQGTVNYYDAIGNQFSSAVAITPAVKITITEITSTYVEGTFSGTAATISTGKTAVITNGSFRVKRQ